METVPLALDPYSGDHLIESSDLSTRYASRHHNGLYCVALFERARDKVTFDRPHWGVLGDPASPDLFGQTAALLRRFRVHIHP